MDHEAYKIRRATPANTEPPIAAILMASVSYLAGEISVAIIRTHDHEGGSALLERFEAGKVVFVQNGEWRLRGDCIGIDFDDSGDVDGLDVVLDRLAAELVKRGEAWGFGEFLARSK